MHQIRKIIKTILSALGIVVLNESRANKHLYITFDDGPNIQFTEKVLTLLNIHNCKATFFLIGSNIKSYPEITKRILTEGHAIGNHSFNHTRFSKMSLKNQLEEIHKTDSLISTIFIDKELSTQRILFRPPQGTVTPGLCLYALFKRRKHYLWSIDSLDYKNISYDEKLQYLKTVKVINGDIILFHDDNDDTVKLLEYILPHWIKQGFSMRNLAG